MVRRFNFKKIDAFATVSSSGNPAGAVYLEPGEDISASEMHRIAIELKGFVNEVGYVRRTGEAAFDLRYYSSEREVDFCGHATVAIMYDLFKGDSGLMMAPSVRITTKHAELLVENRIAEEGAVFISAPAPRSTRCNLSHAGLASALGITEEGMGGPASIVNAGLETLLVPIRDLDCVLSMSPVEAELKRYCQDNSLDIIAVYTADVADRSNAYRTRVFAPTFGYLEDPATGSGNAALGYYLLAEKRWDGGVMSLEQNGHRAEPNIIKLSTRQEGRETRVTIGGGAITRISGHYFLS